MLYSFSSRDFGSPVPACWEMFPESHISKPAEQFGASYYPPKEKQAPNATLLFPSKHLQVACETQILFGIS